MNKHLVRTVVVAMIAPVAGCALVDREGLDRRENTVVLLDPEQGITPAWEHRILRRGATDYAHLESGLGDTIRAKGDVSASILFRIFDEVVPACDKLRWNWYVEKPQQTSDLRTKGSDDVAASIFVMFGDPGIFRDKRVPVLRYVWANKDHPTGEVIVGPYQKEFVRTIVVRTGQITEKQLVVEVVSLREDYQRAFGEPLDSGIHGIGIFTDNDDTAEPVVAHYGKIEALCEP